MKLASLKLINVTQTIGLLCPRRLSEGDSYARCHDYAYAGHVSNQVRARYDDSN